IGGRPAPASDTDAPIRRSGDATRSMGRVDSEASPDSTKRPGRPARAPVRSRIVVPELPASRSASRATCHPGPSTDSNRGTGPAGKCTPSRASEAAVEATSAPGAAPRTTQRPVAIAARISARCDTDLSPGTARSPCSRSTGENVTSIRLDSRSLQPALLLEVEGCGREGLRLAGANCPITPVQVTVQKGTLK